MFNVNFITFLRKPKPRPATTIMIEVTPELFERCARFNVLPEHVINDFVANICWREPESKIDCNPSAAAGWKSAIDYLGSAYANLRVVSESRSQTRHMDAALPRIH